MLRPLLAQFVEITHEGTTVKRDGERINTTVIVMSYPFNPLRCRSSETPKDANCLCRKLTMTSVIQL